MPRPAASNSAGPSSASPPNWGWMRTNMNDSSSEVLGRRADAADDLTEQVVSLWEQGQRPDVRDLLARARPLTAGQLAAVLRADQRERWHRGERILAEDYVRDF